MKSFIDQHVKCFLRNSMVIEGIAILWNDKEIQLQSIDRQSFLIIHDPTHDIILTKVMLSDVSEQFSENLPAKPKIPSQQAATLEEAFELLATGEEVDPMALQAKSTAELKVELAKQERKIVSERMRNHIIGAPKKIQYSHPTFIKKSE